MTEGQGWWIGGGEGGAFYCYGKREGDVKIKEGWVVVTSGYVMRDTLKKLRFSWDPTLKVPPSSTINPQPSNPSPQLSALCPQRCWPE